MVSTNSTATQERPTSQEVIQTVSEKFRATGNEFGQQLQVLMRQANARRLIINDYNGQVLLQVPLTIGLIGGISLILLLSPKRIIIVTIAALFARLYLVIEDDDEGASLDSVKVIPNRRSK